MVGIVQPKADPWCCLHFTKYKFNVYRKKYIRSGRDYAVVGIIGKSKSLDFPTMLIFWSLVRNSVVLAVYLLFSVACFLTVHEHLPNSVSITSTSDLITFDIVSQNFYLVNNIVYVKHNFVDEFLHSFCGQFVT